MARRPRARFEITAEDKTRAAFDRAERGMQAVAKAGLAVAGVGTVLAGVAIKAVGSADAIAKNARASGFAAGAYQELVFAGSQLGIQQQSMTSNLERFTKRIGEAANGTGAAAKMYEALGIDVVDANGRVRDSEDVLRDVAVAMQRLETDAERSAAAAALFGREGIRLGAALQGGPDVLDDYARTARELGLVLGKDLLDEAEAASDQLDRMQKIAGAQATVLGAALFPAVIAVGNAFAEAVPHIKQFMDLLNPDSELRLYGDVAELDKRIAHLQKTIATGAAAQPSQASQDAAGAGGFLGTTSGGLLESIDLDAMRSELEAKLAERAALLAEIQERYKAQRIDTAGIEGDAIGGDALRSGEESEIEKEREKTLRMIAAQENRFQALRESRLEAEGLDLELEQERFEAEMARIEEQNRMILESEQLTDVERAQFRQDARAAEEEAQAAHIARLNALDERRAQDAKRLEDEIASERAQAARRGKAAVIASLQGLAEQSKVVQVAMLAFEKGKAISDVIVLTEVAAARALAELGPIAGKVAAVGIRAAGAASIGLIAAQGIAQASGGGGGGGGGFGSGAPVTRDSGGGAGFGSGVPPRQVLESGQNVAASPVTIIVQAEGVMASSLEDFVDQAQPLIEQGVRKAVTERDVVIIEPGSRQALELQKGAG